MTLSNAINIGGVLEQHGKIAFVTTGATVAIATQFSNIHDVLITPIGTPIPNLRYSVSGGTVTVTRATDSLTVGALTSGQAFNLSAQGVAAFAGTATTAVFAAAGFTAISSVNVTAKSGAIADLSVTWTGTSITVSRSATDPAADATFNITVNGTAAFTTTAATAAVDTGLTGIASAQVTPITTPIPNMNVTIAAGVVTVTRSVTTLTVGTLTSGQEFAICVRGI